MNDRNLDEIRDEYAELIAQLRAMDDAARAVVERQDQLAQRVQEVCGGDDDAEYRVHLEAGWDELHCWAKMVRFRLDPLDASIHPHAEREAAKYTTYGLPDGFVSLAAEQARAELDGAKREYGARDRVRELEGRVFELLTDGLD